MNLSEQISTELTEAKDDFRHILKVAIAASNAAAKTSTDQRGMMVDTLMIRNIVTAISLNQLLEPIAIGGIPALSLADPFSVAVLGRAIAETRLVMFSVASQTLTQEQLQIRLLWWEWHDVCERIRTRDLIKSEKAKSFDGRKSELSKAIRAHPKFSELPSDLRTPFEKGKRPSRATLENLRELAPLAGIHPDRFEVAYQLSSAAAHCEPMVVGLLMRHEPKAVELACTLHLHISEASAFLTFTVQDFAQVFPKARQAIDQRFEEIHAVWSGVFAQPFS